MLVDSLRFGKIEFDESQVIEFPDGLLGFAKLKRFLHLSPDGWEPVEFLLPLDEPALTFPVINPHLSRPDYRFDLDEPARALLSLRPGGSVLAYAVVTFGAGAEDVTVNLLAPVVINPDARRGCQVVLDGSGYEVAVDLLADRQSTPKGDEHAGHPT